MCSIRSVFQGIAGGGLVLALALSGLNSASAEARPAARSGPSHDVRRLSMVIGGAVRIANDASVGTVEDVVLNDGGCIDFVIVAYRDQYVAIPWSAVAVDFGQRIVTVDITAERFATVPTFRRDEFAFLAKTEFTQKVHGAFEGKSEPKANPAGQRAESPKGEPKSEPARTAARETPRVETTDKPKGKPLDTPQGESKDKPKPPARVSPKAVPSIR